MPVAEQRRPRAFSMVFIALVVMRRRIQRCSFSQKTDLYCDFEANAAKGRQRFQVLIDIVKQQKMHGV